MAQIRYHVALVPQAATETCWYACAQMLAGWRRAQVGLRANSGAPVVTNQRDERYHKINRGAEPGDYAAVMRTLGFRAEHEPLNRENLLPWLTAYGPLIYSGFLQGYLGQRSNRIFHAVVIVGAQIDGALALVEVNDPAPPKLGRHHYIDLEQLRQGLEWSSYPVVHV